MTRTRYYRIIPVDALAHAQCHEFVIDEIASEGFLLNWHGRFYAYQNACPHTGVGLNWTPNQFMDNEQKFVMCGMHGALFEPATGLCVHGPCLGRYLRTIPVEVIEGVVCAMIETTVK